MKLTMENPRGTEMSCGSTAAEGYVAREAKSGAFLFPHGKYQLDCVEGAE